MKRSLTFSILFLFSDIAFAVSPKNYGAVEVSRVGTVIDGDSFKVNINQWPDIIGKSITVRITDIDTPELRGKCQKEKDLARKAKQFSVEKLRSAKVVELRDIKRGKYFRIIANVYIDDVSLGGELLKQGLAVVYSKKSKMNWCKQPKE